MTGKYKIEIIFDSFLSYNDTCKMISNWLAIAKNANLIEDTAFFVSREE